MGETGLHLSHADSILSMQNRQGPWYRREWELVPSCGRIEWRYQVYRRDISFEHTSWYYGGIIRQGGG